MICAIGMRRLVGLLAAAAMLGGCGGYYTLTVPDQVAPAGGQARAVARLRRNDFFVLDLAVRNAPIGFIVPGQQDRASYTDDLGYAATTVPVPDKPGRYEMVVSLRDSEGEEMIVRPPLYVWSPDRAVVAVDLDCVPGGSAEAAKALGAISKRANIVYMTRERVSDHPALHERLNRDRCPDGPILLWQRKRWHIARTGRYRIPRVVIESRLESQLGVLRTTFEKLSVGVCSSDLAARAFAGAGLRCAVVGGAKVSPEKVTRFASWGDLAEKGL